MKMTNVFFLWMVVATGRKTTAFPVNDSQIECAVQPVMEGESTSLTCYFNEDLNRTMKSFVVQHRSQLGNFSEILSCNWVPPRRLHCLPEPGFTFDEQFSTTATVGISSASENHVGSYICLVANDNPLLFVPCNFTLIEKGFTGFTDQTVTSDYMEQENSKEEGNTSTVVIVIPVILIILVLICAAVIIFKYWARITERCGKDKTGEDHKRKVSAHDVTKEQELLSQTTSGNEEIQRPLSKDDVDPALEPLVSSEESNATQTQSTMEQSDEVASPDGASDSKPLNAREDIGKLRQAGSSQDQTFTQPNGVKDKGKVKPPDSYLYNRAVGLLERTGAVVITGPEQQRHIFGREVMDHFAECGFSPLELDHPKLWWDKRKSDKRYVVLLNELKADAWSNAALKSMVLYDQCYVIIMIRSDTRNSESGLPFCLQTVPTVDLGQTLTPETRKARQLLNEACQKDDLEQVVNLLSAGFNPQWVDKESKMALHIACERGNAAIVENLLWAGSGVNARDKKWRTPLHFACSSRSEIIPAVQLDSKQTTTASNKVIEKGQDLQKNSVQNVTNDGEDLFFFPESYESPRETIVKRLLACGADPKAADSKSRTPLHVACEHSNCALVAMLLSVGADVNAVDKAGRTPLHVACEHGNCPSVTMLLKFNPNVNAKDKTGCTPLHVACEHAKNDVVTSLLEAGANVKATDKNGCTPLHVASNGGEIVHSLLRAESDVEARDNNQRTPLHLACFKGERDSVEILLMANASVETRTKTGLTPLHAASIGGNKEIVLKLLEKNADIHAKDDRKNTPRDLASYKGHKEIVRILKTAKTGSSV